MKNASAPVSKGNASSACPIPDLANAPVWLLWKSIPNGGDKPRKVPYYADGSPRSGTLNSSQDLARLVDYKAAAAAMTTAHAGIGIALGEFDPEDDAEHVLPLELCGIDLDNVRDPRTGALDERAQKILKACPGTYAEVSPSGKGIKIFGYGNIGTDKRMNCSAGLEIYSTRRFFTVTGEAISESRDLLDLEDVAEVARKQFPDAEKDSRNHSSGSTSSGAKNSKTGGTASSNSGASGTKVSEGGRNAFLTSEAGKLRRIGMDLPVMTAALRALNAGRCDPPLKDAEVEAIARSVAKYEPGRAPAEPVEWKAPVIAKYGKTFDSKKIPKRRWLVGHRRAVGEVTVDAGPPGTNKSMLQLADAVAIATGRKLLADEVHETGGVLFLAGEDARRDVESRIAGILAHYGIKAAELGNRLRVAYLDEAERASDYTLAMMRDDVAALNSRMLDWLREYPDIIAIMVDPLAAWHQLIENSNDALQVLWSALRSVAVRSQRHVGIGHHVTKASMLDPESHVGHLAALRGGSVLGAGVRWAFTMARLRPDTAERHGIKSEEATLYRRLDTLKASYGADDNCQRLLRIESVPIANGESVGVLTEVDLARVHADAQQRAVRAAVEHQKDFADMLMAMLAEKHPRSANGAALWLASHHATRFVGKDGKPLSEFTLRQRLPRLIGKGIKTAKGTIVIREAAGNGKGSAIDYSHSFAEGQK